MYDIWSPYDTRFTDQPQTPPRLIAIQQAWHVALLDLRPLIDDAHRDIDQVYARVQPFQDYTQGTPPSPQDVPEIESLCRLALERGGAGQSVLQEVFLRLAGNAAEPRSLPFLLDMLRFTRRGDSFGPSRRQLALWALARLARWHHLPEAYQALRAGLDDRNAEVRLTAAALLLDANLEAGLDVPPQVVAKLQQMAQDEPDEDVCRSISRYLDEPWAHKQANTSQPSPANGDAPRKTIG